MLNFFIAACGSLIVCELLDKYGLFDKISNGSDPNKEFSLVVGYENNIFRTPIIVNMRYEPHILISGLSYSGKSKLAERMLLNQNVTILNAFDEDYSTLQCEKINGYDNILTFLTSLYDSVECDDPNSYPIRYILIDELLFLMKNKAIEKALLDLLCVARHKNIFIVGICQRGTKEDLKCKDLFNVRICFKMIEESSFRVVLGCSVPNPIIKPRQFYIVCNQGLKFCHTYSL